MNSSIPRKRSRNPITKWDVARAAERFWRRAVCGDETLCWPWRLKPDRDGYGMFSLRGHRVMAHRVAWAIHHQDALPTGKVVMHTCDNPRCCNPGHLVLGSQIQNMADRDAKGRTPAGRAPMRPQPQPQEAIPDVSLPAIRMERDQPFSSGDRAPRSARTTAEILTDLMKKKAAKRQPKSTT